MKYPHACLQIFARAPETGKVKTRLIPSLGADGAARLQSALTHRTLAMTTGARLCPVELWCSPDRYHPFFTHCRRQYPVTLHDQVTGHLGEKMKCAIANGLAHSRYVILVGTDCPVLCSEDIVETLNHLDQGADVSLKPAEDGGYVLIGMRKRVDTIFDGIPWGTGDVMKITRQRLHELSVEYRETPVTWDLDRPDDLHRYRETSGAAVTRQ